VDVPADLTAARVPPFLLQPLVENAIRHGSLRHTGRARITITGARDGDALKLRVSDDGPGPGEPGVARPGGGGIGLSTTAERLWCLYGDDGRLRLGFSPGRGCEVSVVLPYRVAATRDDE
jgi:LytS/YehU family sensor histidine kinase